MQDFPNVMKFNHTAPPCGHATTPHWEKVCRVCLCVCEQVLSRFRVLPVASIRFLEDLESHQPQEDRDVLGDPEMRGQGEG